MSNVSMSNQAWSSRWGLRELWTADGLDVLNRVASNGLSPRSRTSAVKVRLPDTL